MSQERIQRLRDELVKLAIQWEASPRGMAFDSGHTESEIAAGRLDRFLQDTKDAQGLDALFDKLHRLFHQPGTEFGSWRSRAFERSLVGHESIYGRHELFTVLNAAGFGPDMQAAEDRAVSALQAFEASAPPSGRPAAALRFDAEAFLSDPSQTAKLSGPVVDAWRQVLDTSGPDASFRSLARGLNAARRKLEDQGYGNQLGEMRQVLANFGNPDSSLFGIMPDGEGLKVERRYRAPGR